MLGESLLLFFSFSGFWRFFFPLFSFFFFFLSRHFSTTENHTKKLPTVAGATRSRASRKTRPSSSSPRGTSGAGPSPPSRRRRTPSPSAALGPSCPASKTSRTTTSRRCRGRWRATRTSWRLWWSRSRCGVRKKEKKKRKKELLLLVLLLLPSFESLVRVFFLVSTSRERTTLKIELALALTFQDSPRSLSLPPPLSFKTKKIKQSDPFSNRARQASSSLTRATSRQPTTC